LALLFKKFLITNLSVYFKKFFGKLLKSKIFLNSSFPKRHFLAILFGNLLVSSFCQPPCKSDQWRAPNQPQQVLRENQARNKENMVLRENQAQTRENMDSRENQAQTRENMGSRENQAQTREKNLFTMSAR
jgi:hypothetical protein